MNKACCEMMAYWSANHCAEHDSPFACPDWLILRDDDKEGARYGIIIHDGGKSFVPIRYCPWCGSALGQEAAAGDSPR